MNPVEPNDPVRSVETEELLWSLSEVAGDSDEVIPVDTQLQAYRQGRLGGEERRRLEGILAQSRQARRRLAALADADLDAPPAWLRAKILARAPLPARRRRLPVAAAGLAAAVLMGVVLLQLSPPPGLPGDLRYQIVSTGLATTRSATPGVDDGSVEPAVITAYPDTEVRISVMPAGDAMAGVDLGLYREHNGVIQRLDHGDPGAVTVVRQRGAATFSAAAADLVGSVPGSYAVYIVVAVEGDLPATFDPEPGLGVAQLLASDTRRKVYQQTVTVLPYQTGGTGTDR